MNQTISIGFFGIVPVKQQTIGAVVDDGDGDLHVLLLGDGDAIDRIADGDINRVANLQALKGDGGRTSSRLFHNAINCPLAAGIGGSFFTIIPATSAGPIAQVVQVIAVAGNIPISTRNVINSIFTNIRQCQVRATIAANI